MKRVSASCTLLVLSSLLSAQATILVGPNGLPQINDAIAVANDGDVILVEPGAYANIVLIDKSLTIRAVTPGTVTTVSGFFGDLVVGVNGRNTVHMVGLDLGALSANGSRITLDRCTTNNANGLFLTNVHAHLQDCQIVATPFLLLLTSAMQAENSHVTAVDTVFQGAGSGGSGLAVRLVGSTLQGSHVELRAGTGSVGPAVTADAASTVWLSDSLATSAASACPLEVANGRMFRTTLTPNCGALPSGLVLGVRRPHELQTGSPFSLEFTTQAFRPIAIVASADLDRIAVPGIEQAVQLDLGGAFLAGALLANLQGHATWTTNVPASTALVNTTIWFQGLSGLSLPLQASPVTGGVIR